MRVGVAIVWCHALLLVACAEPARPSRKSPTSRERPPAHISYDLRVVFSDSTHTRAVLQAAEARVYDDRQETILRDTVTVAFFSRSSGARVARLSADSAVIDDRTKNMHAFGDVTIWSDSTRTLLETQTLFWDHARQRISTKDFVRITAPSETIQGVGFESDQFLTSYTLYNVQGERR